MGTPVAKFRPWIAIVNGVRKVISVFSTDTVDLSPGLVVSFYDNTKAYAQTSVVIVRSTATVGGVTLTPGTYIAMQPTTANATGNQVPQFPMPSLDANIYWACIALGPQVVNICQNGSKQVYVNSSSAF